MSDDTPAAPPPVHDTPPPTRWAELKADLANATKERDELRAANAKLSGQLSGIKDAHTAAAAQWADERSLLKYGIDDAPGMAAARTAYGALEGDDRPASVGEYVAALVAAASAEDDPQPPPRWLAPYATPTPAAAPEKAPPKQTAAAPPSAGGSVSEEARKALLDQALKSGDWSAFNKAAGITMFSG